jgi:hypothetical protein
MKKQGILLTKDTTNIAIIFVSFFSLFFSCEGLETKSNKATNAVKRIGDTTVVNKYYLEIVGVILESSAEYYDYFRVDSSVYSVTKHKDKNLYRLKSSIWNSQNKKLVKKKDATKLFNNKDLLDNYIKRNFSATTMVHDSIKTTKKDISKKITGRIPKGYDIVQKSIILDNVFILLLMNDSYYFKIFLIDNDNYIELYENINPHKIELSFIDVDLDGRDEILMREFYLYDQYDIYDATVFKLKKRQSGIPPQEPDDQ